MFVTYDSEADALYVQFRDSDVARTVSLDANRNVDYDLDGEVVGVEFLNVRDGLELEGVPWGRRRGSCLEARASYRQLRRVVQGRPRPSRPSAPTSGSADSGQGLSRGRRVHRLPGSDLRAVAPRVVLRVGVRNGSVWEYDLMEGADVVTVLREHFDNA